MGCWDVIASFFLVVKFVVCGLLQRVFWLIFFSSHLFFIVVRLRIDFIVSELYLCFSILLFVCTFYFLLLLLSYVSSFVFWLASCTPALCLFVVYCVLREWSYENTWGRLNSLVTKSQTRHIYDIPIKVVHVHKDSQWMYYNIYVVLCVFAVWVLADSITIA